MKQYKLAIYIRLSKEDDKFKEESNSITMQRMLLQRYIAERFTDYELLEFCDDGYTGTNLNRPGMQTMLELAGNGEIDCILVKDFSRFSRDYIELGSYLEQIFPFLGIRFISLNDNYDSKDYPGSIADIDMNFKNLLYDLYSKDLSQNVRSTLAAKKGAGLYVSANSPFGYEKDPKDRHALLIAEDEAAVVRRIFSLTVEGYTSTEITKLFNETRVKTPIEFKMEKGKTGRIPKGERFVWNNGTICQILKNEIYIGNIVQKKYTKDFVGGKNHLNPREDWLVSYHHHEPIIEKEVFEKVQEGRGKKKNVQHNPRNPLVGKVVCGGCKKSLSYRKKQNPYFSCQHRYTNARENCVDKVNEMYLEQYVLLRMQDKLKADTEGELETLREKRIHESEEKLKELKERRNRLAVMVEKLKQQNFEAYQNYANGKTESFASNKSVIESTEKGLVDLSEKIQETETLCKDRSENRLYAENQLAVFSKDMIESYIDKIVIYNEQQIEIIWKENEGSK